MGPAALIKALALLLSLAGALPADIRRDEELRRQARAEENVRQLLFGQRAVQEAKKQVGRPYVWGGKAPAQGFDCSGLTAYAYGSLGLSLPPSAAGQFSQGVGVERGALQPGDLVFFTGVGSPMHVGIYAGGGRFYHAPSSGKRVKASRLDAANYQRRYLGARRLSPAQTFNVPSNPKKQKEKAS